MINSKKNIYIQETEVKPNKYSTIVLILTMIMVTACWIMNEVGLFRVGDKEMRIGSIISLVCVGVPLLVVNLKKDLISNPKSKFYIMLAGSILTLSTSTLLTFHTTIMLLYPIFIGMLYRSKSLGRFALGSSLFCTIASPILGYLLGTWDVPLFQELILIATGGTAEIVNPTYTFEMTAVLKIVLYIVIPRLMMVGSCSTLMFYVIGIGNDHVQNQLLLNELSRNDAVTGLYNQNYFKEVVEGNELSGQVGIMFFDINGLKKANDSKGHEHGDLLLKRCALSIIDSIDEEKKEYGFRAGGDEFVIIVEDADEEHIKNILDTWKRSLARINRENRESANGIECSLAVGYTIGDAKDIDELVNTADKFMYKNKQESRNKE